MKSKRSRKRTGRGCYCRQCGLWGEDIWAETKIKWVNKWRQHLGEDLCRRREHHVQRPWGRNTAVFLLGTGSELQWRVWESDLWLSSCPKASINQLLQVEQFSSLLSVSASWSAIQWGWIREAFKSWPSLIPYNSKGGGMLSLPFFSLDVLFSMITVLYFSLYLSIMT